MQEQIATKLVIQNAELNYRVVELEVQNGELSNQNNNLQARVAELEALLDERTKPKEGDEHENVGNHQ